MVEKALITSCSNKFFPAVINLIGSIKKHDPDHAPIYVYDQGLFVTFRKELQSIERVVVVPIPSFCGHWKSCYTWKTYIFAHPPARLNFYMDAGFQVSKKLDKVFEQIEKDDYVAIAENLPLEMTTPKEFKNIYLIDDKFYKETYITAGIFGFKTESRITKTLQYLYEAGVAGLCLGFSPDESWRNKGKNRNIFTRDCKLFRFDTTILTLLMRRDLGDFTVSPQEPYERSSPTGQDDQLTFNDRLKQVNSESFKINLLHPKNSWIFIFNRLYIKIFMFAKRISNKIKGTS